MTCSGFRYIVVAALVLVLARPTVGRTLAEAARGMGVEQSSTRSLDLPACIRRAIRKHPALLAARAAVMERRAGLDQARAEGKPMISLSADFSQYRRKHVLNTNSSLSPAMRQTLAEADAFNRLFGQGSSSYVGSGVADLGADFQTYLAGAAAGAGYAGDIAGYFQSLVQGSTVSLTGTAGEIGLHGERVGRARLGLDLPLLTFGRLEGIRQEAGARVRMAEADLAHVTLAMAHAVVQRYLDAHLAWNLRDTRREELERLEALAEIAASQATKEKWKEQDRMYRVEVALGEASEALQEEQSALMQAEAALREAIGDPDPNQQFHFLRPDFHVVAPSEEGAVALAFAHRRDLQREKLALRALQGQLRHARALGRPDVHLSGELSTFRDNEDFPNPDPRTDYRIMIGGSLPLFDGGRSRSRSREARANLRRQKARIQELENAIRCDVQQSLLVLDEGEERLELAWRRLDAARRHADLLGRAFESKHCPLKRSIEGQIALAEAREAFHRAIDRRDRAITALSRSTGVNTVLDEAEYMLSRNEAQ